jgi:DNA-directed RNA polymerase subunit RPC12/RpoP
MGNPIQKGYVCNKCGSWILGEEIKVTRTTEYEGMTVYVFNCPSCLKETDDLQCDPWFECESEYYALDDGYSIVGYGYKCGYCGKENNFVSEEDEEQVCTCGCVNKLKPINN